MNIQELANEMRKKADATPWNPFVNGPAIRDYQRRETIDDYPFILTFTLTTVGRLQMYQLSIGNDEANPKLLPIETVEKIKLAFRTLDSWPSVLRNCLQFVGQI